MNSKEMSNWFEEFWSTYPRKVGKIAAEKAYAKAVDTIDPKKIRDAAKRYRELCAGKDPQYIAHPSTWLNRGSWDDDTAANGKDIGVLMENERYARTFTDEYPFARAMAHGGPRAIEWANCFVPVGAPQFRAVLAWCKRPETDPRLYRIEKPNGVWVNFWRLVDRRI